MHLDNITPSMPNQQKNIQARIWFALTSFEICLCTITGRPTMIHENACTVSLPMRGMDIEEEVAIQSKIHALKATSEYRHIVEDGSRRQPALSAEIEFFRLYLALAHMAQDILQALYNPGIQEERSREVYSMIRGFNERLKQWQNRVKHPFMCPISRASSTDAAVSYNVALTLFYHTVRILVNRPCLCAPDTSSSSGHAQNAVNLCIASARSIIKLLCTTPIAILFHRSPLWWLLFHHHRRAMIVILLGLAFRAKTMPSLTEDLLSDARRGLEWIGRRAATSDAAQDTFTTMTEYLQLTTQRVGIDTTHETVKAGTQVASDDDDEVDTPLTEHQRSRDHPPHRPSRTHHRHGSERRPPSTFETTSKQSRSDGYDPSTLDGLDFTNYDSLNSAFQHGHANSESVLDPDIAAPDNFDVDGFSQPQYQQSQSQPQSQQSAPHQRTHYQQPGTRGTGVPTGTESVDGVDGDVQMSGVDQMPAGRDHDHDHDHGRELFDPSHDFFHLYSYPSP